MTVAPVSRSDALAAAMDLDSALHEYLTATGPGQHQWNAVLSAWVDLRRALRTYTGDEFRGVVQTRG